MLTSACGTRSSCTVVQAGSSVNVRLLRADYPDLAGGTFHLCAASHCARGTLQPASLLSTHVFLPSDVGARTVTVRLRLTAPGAHSPSVDQRTTTTLIRTDTICDGTYYWRELALTPAGGLSESVPTTGPWDLKNAARPTAPPARPSTAGASQEPTDRTTVSPSP